MLSFWAVVAFLKDNIKWLVIGAMALVIAFFVWSWGSRGTEIAELQGKLDKQALIIKTLEANVGIEQMNQELQQATTEEIAKRLTERSKHLDEMCKTWSKIDEENPDPVGTVLDSLPSDRVQ